MYRRVEKINRIDCCVGGGIINRMACSRDDNLAYLWERRSSWRRREIVCEAKGIQSSPVNCSPCHVSFELPETLPSGVGVSMVWGERKLRGRAAIR